MIMTLDWIRYLNLINIFFFFYQIQASLTQTRVKSWIRSVLYIYIFRIEANLAEGPRTRIEANLAEGYIIMILYFLFFGTPELPSMFKEFYNHSSS